jgi:hypothetical protein
MSREVPLAERNITYFDSNIDAYYVDVKGNLKKVENVIQVVSGTDGSTSYPLPGEENIPESELSDITDLEVQVSNIGHGILYNKDGSPYAHKGEMVFRDGLGNKSTIRSVINKVSTINQRNLDTKLKDTSLNQVIQTTLGLDLDQIILNAQVIKNPFGTGNIRQAVRNSDRNKTQVSVITIPITQNNHVWILGKASVQGDAIVQLIDLTAETVLDTSNVKILNPGNIIPVFLSYAGTLPEVTKPIDAECDVAIYNSFFKRYFTKNETIENNSNNIHEIALVVITDLTITDSEFEAVEEAGSVVDKTPFVQGTIDMLVIDTPSTEKILNDRIIVRESTEHDISFDNELPNDTYSINIQTDLFVQVWYSEKTTSGFTINFEREFTGVVYWTVVYKDI